MAFANCWIFKSSRSLNRKVANYFSWDTYQNIITIDKKYNIKKLYKVISQQEFERQVKERKQNNNYDSFEIF